MDLLSGAMVGDGARSTLTDFSDMHGAADEVYYNDVWMPDHEFQALQQFKAGLPMKLIGCTMFWVTLHIASILLSPVFSGPDTGMTRKDKLRWHNKFVSLSHAAVAFVQGLWWITASGEHQKTAGRVFGFFPANAEIGALGASYFMYDLVFCSVTTIVAYEKQLPMILVHHVIFILAYFSTMVYPCVLSVTSYHYFQLTELSTVMLHVAWMMSKAQVQYAYLFWGTIALLATFLQRVVTTFFIMWHVCAQIGDQELWKVKLPYGLSKYNYLYVGYFGACTSIMLLLNWTWFTLLVARANDMVKRVQSGREPTPDYERSTKKAS